MIKLMRGDCLERMKGISDQSIDLILTDPPYGIIACKWDSVIPLNLMWKELERITKLNCAIVLFGSQPFTSKLISSNYKIFKYEWIYVKSQATNFLNAKKQPLRNHENILVFYKKQCIYNPQKIKGKPYTCKDFPRNLSISADPNIIKGGHLTINKGDRFPLTVMDKVNVENHFHPTQKPVKLLEYLIKTYSNKKDLVLDFTMGSGSTGVACKNLKRSFIGIELDKKYYQIARKRILGR